MDFFYLWVREHKNIQKVGFNFSSKVFFNTYIQSIDDDGTLNLSLVEERENTLDIFPVNIIDVKAVLGENGSGKSNLLFWLLNFIMNKKTGTFGFLITSEFIIVRDRINFTNVPEIVLGKKLEIIYPEDIINFNRDVYKAKVNRNQAFQMIGNNLMETYFKEKYVIFYSNSLNQDNYYNSEGIQSSYALWESQEANYFDISTESFIVHDYYNLNNNLEYFITGESELLSYKFLESIRALEFISIEENLNLNIKFPIHTINVGFTGFNAKFWNSIDYIISPNSNFNRSIENILNFEKNRVDHLDYQAQFMEELSKEIMYCLMSFQFKHYFNSSPEEKFPIVELIENLRMNYNSKLESFEAIFEYIRTCGTFERNKDYLIEQIYEVKNYFKSKFDSSEIICNGIYGFVIPEINVRNIINDFSNSSLFALKTSQDDEYKIIRLNMFGFSLYGLSAGERNFLSLFSRLNWIKKSLVEQRDILFLIDEGELGFHPQWQKEYFKVLIDFFEKFFPKNKLQLIITSHSPFLASDLPKENIIFLEKDGKNTKISDLNKHEMTFASNIHSLYSDAFFIKGATIGSFSKDILNEIVDYLKGNEFSEDRNDRYREIIKIVGEPVIKRKLEDLWIEKLGKSEELIILKNRISYLESQK